MCLVLGNMAKFVLRVFATFRDRSLKVSMHLVTSLLRGYADSSNLQPVMKASPLHCGCGVLPVDTGGAAAQHGRRHLAVQQLHDPAGHRDPGHTHGKTL